MRTELMIVVALLGGCVGTTLNADLDRIERSVGRSLPGQVLDPVDLALDAQVEVALQQPLEVDTAVRVAIANHRELRATLRDLGVTRGRLLQATLLPNPEFEVDFRQSDDETQPLQTELTASFDLTHALLTPLRGAVARKDLEAARLRAAGRVLKLEYEVRAAYYAALAAEQQLRAAVRSLDALAAARDSAVMLHNAGSIPELDLAAQVAAYEEAHAGVAELELTRATSRERLQRLLGVHGVATAWEFAGELDAEVEADMPSDLERVAIEASLELREIRARVEGLHRGVELASASGWIPDVTVHLDAEQDGQAWELGGGASVSVPLFDRNDGTVVALAAERDATLERFEGAAIDIRSVARELRGRVMSAQRRAEQYTRVIVPARTRVFEQTLLQYNAMQVGVFQLVSARRGQLASEIEAIAALARYWTERAALDALVRGQRVLAMDVGPVAGMSADTDSAGGH